MNFDPQADTNAGPTAATAPAGVPNGDWTATLSPELRHVVEVKGYKSPADVVSAYAHAQKAIGLDKVAVPRDGVWDDDARAKLGIPRDPDGYQLRRPDNLPQGLNYDEGFEKAALPVAHKLGLTPVQVQGLLDFYAGYAGEVHKNSTLAVEHGNQHAASVLKKDWGAFYDERIQQAQVAVKHFGGQGLVDHLNRSGLGNHPELIRAFARIGSMMSEDQLRVGAASGFGLSPAEARKEANKMMAQPAYTERDHPDHNVTVEKVKALFEQVYDEAE
jgi:hypothetical protein